MYGNKLLLWNTILCECGSVHMQPTNVDVLVSDYSIVTAPATAILYISTLAFVTTNPQCLLFLYASCPCQSSCPPSVTDPPHPLSAYH